MFLKLVIFENFHMAILYNVEHTRSFAIKMTNFMFQSIFMNKIHFCQVIILAKFVEDRARWRLKTGTARSLYAQLYDGFEKEQINRFIRICRYHSLRNNFGFYQKSLLFSWY